MKITSILNQLSTQEIAKLTIQLFVVINVLSAIPFMIRAKKVSGKINALKCTGTGLTLSILFLLVGKYLLAINEVSITIFRAAGGVVLLLLGIEMVFDITISKMTIEDGKDPSVVPLSFPMTIGAGTLTTLVSFREMYALINVLGALFLNTLLIYLILSWAEKIEKIVGVLFLQVLQRITGLLLISFAIQALKNGFFS
ncbi:MAG: MarC family protein [Bacteroidota bacterium]